MGKTIKLMADAQDHIISIDGKWYRLDRTTERKNGHRAAVLFKLNDEGKYKEKVSKLTDIIIEQSKINSHQIVMDALLQLPMENIRKIENQLKDKKRARIQKGCLQIMVGKESIPLIQ